LLLPPYLVPVIATAINHLLPLIGKGAAGLVYKAQIGETLVALKQAIPERQDDEKDVLSNFEAFTHEAFIMR